MTYEAWRLKTQGTNRNVRPSGRGRWEKHASTARAVQALTCSANIYQRKPDMKADNRGLCVRMTEDAFFRFIFEINRPLIWLFTLNISPVPLCAGPLSASSTLTELFLDFKETHLGSLQHLPLVENLHGEDLVGVFHFYNRNLRKRADNVLR